MGRKKWNKFWNVPSKTCYRHESLSPSIHCSKTQLKKIEQECQKAFENVEEYLIRSPGKALPVLERLEIKNKIKK